LVSRPVISTAISMALTGHPFRQEFQLRPWF
jgi:hypothetical protein